MNFTYLFKVKLHYALAFLYLFLFINGYGQLGLIPQPISFCKYIQQYEVDNLPGRMTHQACIISPVIGQQTSTVNINGAKNVEFISGASVQLQPGFQAGNFNAGGSFKAAIEKGDLSLAVFTPYDFSTGSVLRYEKLEIGILFSSTIRNLFENFENDQSPALNPFNPDEVDVQAQFYWLNDNTNQWEEKQTIFGFYYNEYIRNTSDPDHLNWNWIKDTTSYKFRLRFATPEFGRWKCKVTANIQGYGTFEAQEFEYFCVSSTDLYSGFMKVGNTNHYFRLSGDDRFYLPVGQNLPHVQCDGCDNPNEKSLEPYGYQTVLPRSWIYFQSVMEDLAEVGGDYFRLFISPWADEIEFERLNNYSARLSNAWEMDRILDKALSENLRIQLSLFTPYILQNEAPFSLFYWDWPENRNCTMPDVNDVGFCYKTELGLTEPREFFTDPVAINYYKKRIRYLIARYGYSQNIGMLELMSEVNTAAAENEYAFHPANCIYLNGNNLYQTDPTFPPQVYAWQNEIARYIKQDLGHKNHLVTVNYAGLPDVAGGDFSFFSDFVDVITYNSYFMSTQPAKKYHDDVAAQVSVQKPLIFSETGAIVYSLGGDFDPCSNYTEWKKRIWATAFSGAAVAGMNWSGDFNINPVWEVMGRLRTIIGNADFDDGTWQPHWDERDTDHEAEVIYQKSLTHYKAIGVVFNRNWNWFTRGTGMCLNLGAAPELSYRNSEDVSWNIPALQIFNRIHIDNLGSFQNYQIDWFDALTGEFIIAQGRNTGIDGKIVLEYPKLSMVEYEQPMLVFRLYRQGDNWFDQEENRMSINQHLETNLENSTNSNFEIAIFPNPTHDEFTIQISGGFSKAELEIYTLAGELILSHQLSDLTSIIDIRKMVSGIYFIKVDTPLGAFYKKIIKL